MMTLQILVQNLRPRLMSFAAFSCKTLMLNCTTTPPNYSVKMNQYYYFHISSCIQVLYIRHQQQRNVYYALTYVRCWFVGASVTGCHAHGI